MDGAERNYNLYELLQKADDGDLAAMETAARMLSEDGYLSDDPAGEIAKRRVSYIQRLVDAGKETAFVMMGDAYRRGKGVPENLGEAFRWYEKAAENGDRLGNERLGMLYYGGEGVPIDYRKAYEYFTKDQGKKSFAVSYALGEMNRLGLYLVQNYDRACLHYSNIVEDEEEPYPEKDEYYWRACFRLGMLTYYGRGTGKDTDAALRWIRTAKDLYASHSSFSVPFDITEEELYAGWRAVSSAHEAAPRVFPHLQCPCCGYYTLDYEAPDYDICPVCFWENNAHQFEDPLCDGGPNHESLIEARILFRETGAVSDHIRKYVRHPKDRELTGISYQSPICWRDEAKDIFYVSYATLVSEGALDCAIRTYDWREEWRERHMEDIPSSGLKQLSFPETVRAFSTYEVKKSFREKMIPEDWEVLQNLLGVDKEMFTHFSDEETSAFWKALNEKAKSGGDGNEVARKLLEKAEPLDPPIWDVPEWMTKW